MLDGNLDGDDIGNDGGGHVIDHESHGEMLWLYHPNMSICLRNTGPEDPRKDCKERMGEGGRIFP